MSSPPFFVMPKNLLFSLGLPMAENTFYQLSRDKLIQQCIERKEDTLNNSVKQPGDIYQNIFIVKDNTTANTVDWNNNQPLEEEAFNNLYQKMIAHLSEKNIWIRDSYVGDNAADRLYIRSVSEDPESDLFVYNMFLHLTKKEIENFNPDWYIIHTPTFSAGSKSDDTISTNGVFISFTKKIILVAGVDYTPEIKKEILSSLLIKTTHTTVRQSG